MGRGWCVQRAGGGAYIAFTRPKFGIPIRTRFGQVLDGSRAFPTLHEPTTGLPRPTSGSLPAPLCKGAERSSLQPLILVAWSGVCVLIDAGILIPSSTHDKVEVEVSVFEPAVLQIARDLNRDLRQLSQQISRSAFHPAWIRLVSSDLVHSKALSLRYVLVRLLLEQPFSLHVLCQVRHSYLAMS